jgi:rhodanese-related sulfurtransferase
MKMSLLFVLAIGLQLFAGCAGAQNNSESADYKPNEFNAEMQKQDCIILDVRTPDEFNAGHLKGAVNFNWNGADFQSAVEKLDKNKKVFVYCAVGGRSAKAKVAMQKAGFKQVHNMLGGIEAWKKDSLPLE